jgi:hypothetical protein
VVDSCPASPTHNPIPDSTPFERNRGQTGLGSGTGVGTGVGIGVGDGSSPYRRRKILQDAMDHPCMEVNGGGEYRKSNHGNSHYNNERSDENNSHYYNGKCDESNSHYRIKEPPPGQFSIEGDDDDEESLSISQHQQPTSHTETPHTNHDILSQAVKILESSELENSKRNPEKPLFLYKEKGPYFLEFEETPRSSRQGSDALAPKGVEKLGTGSGSVGVGVGVGMGGRKREGSSASMSTGVGVGGVGCIENPMRNGVIGGTGIGTGGTLDKSIFEIGNTSEKSDNSQLPPHSQYHPHSHSQSLSQSLSHPLSQHTHTAHSHQSTVDYRNMGEMRDEDSSEYEGRALRLRVDSETELVQHSQRITNNPMLWLNDDKNYRDNEYSPTANSNSNEILNNNNFNNFNNINNNLEYSENNANSNLNINIDISHQNNTQSKIETFVLRPTGLWNILVELGCSKTFWRFTAFTLLLVNLKAIFRHLDATLPTYLVRTFGKNVPKGKIYSINPFMIIFLTPLVSALTSSSAHYDMIKYGSYISAASPFFVAFSTSIWAVIW